MSATIKNIEEKIDLLVSQNIENKQVILESVLNFLETKYESEKLTEHEKRIVSDVKQKILFRIQGAADSFLPVNPYTVTDTFKLDSQESKYYERACKELDADGLIRINKLGFGMTDKGHSELKGLY